MSRPSDALLGLYGVFSQDSFACINNVHLERFLVADSIQVPICYGQVIRDDKGFRMVIAKYHFPCRKMTHYKERHWTCLATLCSAHFHDWQRHYDVDPP
jgi:hypothetical protein